VRGSNVMVTDQKFRRIFSCALSNGIPRRSFYVALVVGTILNFVNQGDALLVHASINWIKMILTYLVPYGVCTYGAVSMQLRPTLVNANDPRR
jgi:hypothetical protein